MSLKIPMLLTIGFMLVAIGCASDSVDSTSKTDMLCSGTWKITKFDNFVASTGAKTDYSLESCAADDTYTFSSNHNLVVSPGTVNCSPNEGSFTIKWQFDNSENKLTWYDVDPSDGEVFTILNLTSTSMRLRSAADFDSYDELTFSH